MSIKNKMTLEEIKEREHALRECGLAVEKNKALYKEMEEWNVTLEDGLSINKQSS